MIKKIKEKQQAIILRQKGYTYSEIIEKVHVSKASLSLWLKEVPVSASLIKKIQKKWQKSREMGWHKKRSIRIERTISIKNQAYFEVQKRIKNPLWLSGVILYWAEGSKQKLTNVSQSVVFSNSDPKMILMFQRWLKLIGIHQQDIHYEIYIHKSYQSKKDQILHYWANAIQAHESYFRIYFKQHHVKSKRKNIEEHSGVLRIRVKKSTDLNRKISGWIEGLENLL